jgi:hypothetical protein
MKLLLLIMLALQVVVASAQQEIFLTGSLNSYLPINSENRAVILVGSNKGTKPKNFFGGFGIGVTVVKNLEGKINIKGSCNLSQHTYRNAAIIFVDNNNTPLGEYESHSNDYLFSFQGMGRYALGEKLHFGAGLGVDLLMLSLVENPLGSFSGRDKVTFIRDSNYRSIMPVFPLELSIKNPRAFYTLRYEQALLNKFKGDLAKTAKQSYGVILFEVGIRIK